MNITELDNENLRRLLGENLVDTKGFPDLSIHREPNKNDRIILIGLGGEGVRTVDRVKGLIMSKLKPSWRDYIAFLGIDADWIDLKHTKWLEPNECKMITKSGVGTRSKFPETRSIAQRKLLPSEHLLYGVDGPGTGGRRQTGKFKLYDQDPGEPGTDESIVHCIERIIADRLAPLYHGTNDEYTVYVVGSVCGGTGGGLLTEMPALIERALRGRAVNIQAIVYLPDIYAALNPGLRPEMMVRGYASLKELDYFMGQYMRPGYQDVWGYNDACNPEIKLPKEPHWYHNFYNAVYLVGNPEPDSKEGARTARETVCQYLASIAENQNDENGSVVPMREYFDRILYPGIFYRDYKNPVTKTEEATGENHDRPLRYRSFGYAEASVPTKLIRAYMVGQLCKRSGLRSVSAEDHKKMHALGAPLLPFRAEDDLYSASEGSKLAKKLLEPILELPKLIHQASFSFVADLNQPAEPTWNKIKNCEYDNLAIAMITSNVVHNRSNDNMMSRIVAMFEAYKTNVLEFVKEEGPLAFYNLFKGNFICEDGSCEDGIETMLQNLAEGKNASGKPYPWLDVSTAESQLGIARQAIDTTQRTLFNGKTRMMQCAGWVYAYEALQKAHIVTARRSVALGKAGMIYQYCLSPAQKLAEELRYFGHILEALSDIYEKNGADFESFESFAHAQSNRTQVNIASLFLPVYIGLKRETDKAIAQVNYRNIRDGLVEDFFHNCKEWLALPKDIVVKPYDGYVDLFDEESPIPARLRFDFCLAEWLPPVKMMTIAELFAELNNNGSSIQETAKAIVGAAEAIVGALAEKSKPQIDARTPIRQTVLIYPRSLFSLGGIGPQVHFALLQAFGHRFPGASSRLFPTCEETIHIYQATDLFALYKLPELPLWERNYDSWITSRAYREEMCSAGITSGLHTMSPSAVGTMGEVYREVMPWEDYPAITLQATDPREPDPVTGKISREGELRKALDRRIEEAKQLGVLYVEKHDEKNYLVNLVYSDDLASWEHFDCRNCRTDEETGLVLPCEAFALSVAKQNGIEDLKQISEHVILARGGIFSGATESEELAWKNAARVLRAHVPMYLRLCSVLEKFRPWGEEAGIGK